MKYRKEEIEVINNALKFYSCSKEKESFKEMKDFSVESCNDSKTDIYLSKINDYKKEN